jgi:opacity protein-like surface antigen
MKHAARGASLELETCGMKRSIENHTRLARCTGACAIALGAATLAWSETAAAENTLGVAVDFADGIDQSGTNSGAGAQVYFGPRMNLVLIDLTTELNGGFHTFGGDFNPAIYKLTAGGRLGIGVIIRPSVFAHVGVGHLRYNEFLTGEREGRTNLAGDVGLALDLSLIPHIDFGVHGSYNVLAGGANSDAFKWYQTGAHVTFAFDG